MPSLRQTVAKQGPPRGPFFVLALRQSVVSGASNSRLDMRRTVASLRRTPRRTPRRHLRQTVASTAKSPYESETYKTKKVRYLVPGI